MPTQVGTQAAEHFLMHEPFGKGNTTITITDDITTMRLHGNLIAKIGKNVKDQEVILIRDAGYQTKVTRDRLAAIAEQNSNNHYTVSFQKGKSYIKLCSIHESSKCFTKKERLYPFNENGWTSLNDASKHFANLLKEKMEIAKRGEALHYAEKLVKQALENGNNETIYAIIGGLIAEIPGNKIKNFAKTYKEHIQ